MRVDGSQSKHRFKKSTNIGSSQPFNAALHSFEPGRPRIFPRRERPPCKAVEPSGKVTKVQ